MGKLIRRCVLGVLLLALPAAQALADAISEARTLIDQRKYDQAIVLLEKELAAGNKAATVYNDLGRAYQWKRDYDNALKNYRIAAELDEQYITSALPMLEHFKYYNEMINIGETALAKGNKDPWVLTALLNAYFASNDTANYDRVLVVLKTATYTGDYAQDYQKYVLAKAEVRAGRLNEAMAYIERMKTKSLLNFMRTASAFEPLKKFPRFLELTK